MFFNVKVSKGDHLVVLGPFEGATESVFPALGRVQKPYESFHLLNNIVSFSLLGFKGNLSLLDIGYFFPRGASQQMEVGGLWWFVVVCLVFASKGFNMGGFPSKELWFSPQTPPGKSPM